jgi:hypothetical protein
MELGESEHRSVQAFRSGVFMKISSARQPTGEFPQVSSQGYIGLTVPRAKWDGQLREAILRDVTEHVVD